jgi:hypothetical protein
MRPDLDGTGVMYRDENVTITEVQHFVAMSTYPFCSVSYNTLQWIVYCAIKRIFPHSPSSAKYRVVQKLPVTWSLTRGRPCRVAFAPLCIGWKYICNLRIYLRKIFIETCHTLQLRGKKSPFTFTEAGSRTSTFPDESSPHDIFLIISHSFIPLSLRFPNEILYESPCLKPAMHLYMSSPSTAYSQ